MVAASQQRGTRGDCSPLAHLHHMGGEHRARVPAWLKPRIAICRAARRAGEHSKAEQNRSCCITPLSDRLFSRGCSIWDGCSKEGLAWPADWFGSVFSLKKVHLRDGTQHGQAAFPSANWGSWQETGGLCLPAPVFAWSESSPELIESTKPSRLLTGA